MGKTLYTEVKDSVMSEDNEKIVYLSEEDMYMLLAMSMSTERKNVDLMVQDILVFRRLFAFLLSELTLRRNDVHTIRAVVGNALERAGVENPHDQLNLSSGLQEVEEEIDWLVSVEQAEWWNIFIRESIQEAIDARDVDDIEQYVTECRIAARRLVDAVRLHRAIARRLEEIFPNIKNVLEEEKQKDDGR